MQIRNYAQTSSSYYSFKKEYAKKTEANPSALSEEVKKSKGTAETSEKDDKDVEYENMKTGKNGELLGLSKGTWHVIDADLESTKCGPNEIVVVGDGDKAFVKIGVNVMLSLITSGRTPFSIQEDKGFSNMPNGIGLVPGRMVTLPDGTTLKWTKTGVEYIPRRTSNQNESVAALEYAARITSAMNQFTRVANGQALGVGSVVGITKEKTREISTVLRAMGIDTSRDFYVNGKKFTFDSKSGSFKYDLESSSDGGYGVRFVKAKPIRLAEKRKIKLNA